MSEISSFNELFASAARRGLRLNNFFQTGDDSFRCNWRLSGGECAAFADDKTPFLAALKAFETAVAQLLPTTEICDIPVVADPSIPVGLVELRDARGEVIAAIDVSPPDLFA